MPIWSRPYIVLIVECQPHPVEMEYVHAWFIFVNTQFLRQISCVLPHGIPPKPFISGAIENKVKKGGFQFCARSNLRLLSFNNPEYRRYKLASTLKLHRRQF